MTAMKLIPAALPLALLAGCAAGEPSIEGVRDLRSVMEDAGYECPEYAETEDPVNALEAAECSPTTVILVFESQEDIERQLDDYAAFGDIIGEVLVGPNWIVNGDLGPMLDLQEEIGGEIVDVSDR